MAKHAKGPERPEFDGVMGPGGSIGLPSVRTLSDEYRDRPEPEDSDRVPEPERPGVLRRFVDRVLHKPA